MNRSRSAWLAVAATLVVASTVVVTQPARADANAEARVFFEEGSRHLAAALRLHGARRTRELEQALAAYVSSIRIVRSRNAVYNAGVALEELSRESEAYGYFAEYVAMQGVTEADRTEAQHRMEAIAPRIAVVVVSSTPNAEVRVDRRDLAAVGTTPLEFALPAGEHTLWFSRDGYDTAERHVTATIGQRERLSVDLAALAVVLRVLAQDATRAFLDDGAIELNADVRVAPGRHVVRLERPDGSREERSVTLEPGAAPTEIDASAATATVAARAHVVLESNVRARVLANGRPLGTGTRVRGDVDAGNVLLHVEAAGYAPYETTLTAVGGRTSRVRARLERSRAGESRLGSWPLLTGLLSAAAGGVAVVLSVRAAIFKSDWEDALQANREMPNVTTVVAAEEAANRLDNANRLADIFWVTTAVLGTTALVLALVNGDVEQPPSTGTVAIAPVPGGAMLVAELPWRSQ